MSPYNEFTDFIFKFACCVTHWTSLAMSIELVQTL